MSSPEYIVGAGQPCYGSMQMQSPGAAEILGPAMPVKKTPPRVMRLLQVISILTCLVLPCCIFGTLLGATSFGVQRQGLVEVGTAILVVLLGVLAHGAWREGRGSVWHISLFATSAIAWIAAVALGSQSYASLTSYYNMINMATYIEVHPLEGQAGALMQDAGRVLFTPETYVDRSKGIAFKATDLYCAAPVVAPLRNGVSPATEKAVSYDFWAVGVNCCDGSGSNFTCGEVFNPKAFAGVRSMDATQQGFYRMAIQQAEAKYGIKVEHPLFFHWAHDPWAELTGSWDKVCHQLLVRIMTFCTAQFFAVLLLTFAVAARSKAED